MTKNLYLKKKKVFANNAIFSKIMSQSKDFFLLIQALNISKQISINGGATIKAYREKQLTKNGGTMKNVIALNLYIGTNVLVYEKRLMVKVWSMTKFLC